MCSFVPFTSGKKYAKLKEEAGGKALVAKYDPILSPSINFPDKLFCAVSNLLIDTNASAIEKHMSGRRFKAAMGAWVLGAGMPSVRLDDVAS